MDDEADRIDGTPHPRDARALIGHADDERALLDGYRNGRLPHAIILGGQAGIGKATLAWRLARFVLANPLPQARAVREATDLSVPDGSQVAARISSLSHPDVGLLRREVNEKTKRLYTEIRADDVRRVIGLFQRAAGAGGYRVCIVDSAEDLKPIERQRPPQADRGAAPQVAVPPDRPSPGPRPADDPLAREAGSVGLARRG